MQVVPKQVSTLWQTFQSWLHPPAPTPMSDWRHLASKQSRCAFVTWLADEVAYDLLANKPRHLPMEELTDSVWTCESSNMQQRAEHFLRNYYYIYPCDPHFPKVLRIFRHLIQKKLRQYPLH